MRSKPPILKNAREVFMSSFRGPEELSILKRRRWFSVVRPRQSAVEALESRTLFSFYATVHVDHGIWPNYRGMPFDGSVIEDADWDHDDGQRPQNLQVAALSTDEEGNEICTSDLSKETDTYGEITGFVGGLIRVRPPQDGGMDGAGMFGGTSGDYWLAWSVDDLDSGCGTASSQPVRYADGAAEVAFPDNFLPSPEGTASPLTMSWSNGSNDQDLQAASFGAQISFDGMPVMQNINLEWPDSYASSGPSQESISLVGVALSSTSSVLLMQNQVGQWQCNDSASCSAIRDQNGEFYLTEPSGCTLQFADFGSTWPQSQQGKFLGETEPDGSGESVQWNPAGTLPTSITQTYTTYQGPTPVVTTEQYAFSYVGGTSEVASVVQSCNNIAVRSVDYSYYSNGSSNGQEGDLQLITTYDGTDSSLPVGHEYFRWYTGESATGYAGALKMYLSDTAFEKALHDQGVTSLDSVPDATLTNYSDHYFQYDTDPNAPTTITGNPRVSEEIAQATGGGCSCGRTGEGLYTFTYSLRQSADSDGGINDWSNRTVETLPDGDENIVYTDDHGRPILTLRDDVSSGIQYASWARYDDAGDVIVKATGNEVTGYSESFDDLVGYGQTGTYLSATGSISVYNYYGTGDSTLDGYEESQGYQIGPGGKFVPTEAWTYTDDNAANDGIWYVSSDTTYPGVGGPRTTSYTYNSFWPANAESASVPLEITETLPSSASGVPGQSPSAADQIVGYYDSAGRLVWSVDPEGYIDYFQYDPLTGAQIEEVDDVDPSTITTAGVPGPVRSSSLPPALNLTTTTEVDDQGRPIKVTDPDGNVTYSVYDDTTADGDPLKVITYSGWNAATNQPTGPVSATITDPATGITDTVTYTWSGPGGLPVNANGAPTGTESFSSPYMHIDSLLRKRANVSGQVVEEDTYTNLAGLSYDPGAAGWASLGTVGVNYVGTKYKYDAGARLYQTTTPNGTVTINVFDARGLMLSTWVGTNAAGATEADPTGGGAAGNNMVETDVYTYDADGNRLTQEKIDGSGAGDNYLTSYQYNALDQLTDVRSPTGIVTHYILDNLGETVETDIYADLNDNFVEDTGEAVGKTTDSYNAWGQVDQQTVFSVDPKTGVIGTGDTTNIFYDGDGDVAAIELPTGLWTKDLYDGDGRLIDQYTTSGSAYTAALAAGVSDSDILFGDATSASGDVVLSQSAYAYDGDGNLLETVTADRDSTDPSTATGTLGDPAGAGGPAARVSYTASYYDAIGRDIADVNVGTNGGLDWIPPGFDALGPSATELVTFDQYDKAGRLSGVIDPDGETTAYTYDDAGRLIKQVNDYTGNGTPTDSSNQTTTYAYDGDDNLISETAVMPAGETSQTTDYIYGVTTAQGSDLDDNDLLYQVEYPDPNTGNASSSQAETYTYDLQGEKLTYNDRDGTTHAYTYDAPGQLTSDAITQFGAGVDQSVAMLGYIYNKAGLLASTTSYSSPAGGTANIVNQDVEAYDAFGQLASEAESVDGPVTDDTPVVQYTYDAANDDRLTGIIYPDGRTLAYTYGAVGSLTSIASQIASISDASGPLQSYTYLGLDTPVTFTDGNGTELTYLSTNGSTGDAGDEYIGLDRFGRIVDQKWVNAAGTPVDEHVYTYDTDGNVLTDDNTVVPTQSDVYTYDGLNRLTSYSQGTLNTAGTALTSTNTTESWGLDALGNWKGETVNGVTTTRTNNAQNQIVSVTTPGTGGANTTATLGYDANGNTTTDQSGQQYVYDAWNRLVAVKNASGSAIATYTYDAQGRQVTATESGATNDSYYSDQWQVLEQRQAGQVTTQYVWNPFYVDSLIERDTGAAANTAESDGSVDTSFGNSGSASVAADPSGGSIVAAEANGDYLVISLSDVYDENNSTLSIKRFTSAGLLDPSFGIAGTVIIAVPGWGLISSGATVESDGKILFAVQDDACPQGSSCCVVRLDQDGQLDQSFGTAGLASWTIPGETVGPINFSALAIGPAGQIYGGGIDYFDGGSVTFGELSSSGQTIGGFTRELINEYGFTYPDIFPDSFDVQSIFVLPNGNVVALVTGLEGAGGQVVFAEMTSTATPDESINDNAPDSSVDLNIAFETCSAVLVGSELVVCGSNGDDVSIYGINSQGVLDESFGSLSDPSEVNVGASGVSLFLGSDGSFYSAGSVLKNGETLLAVTKFDSNGTLDTSWGNNGTVTGTQPIDSCFGAVMSPNGQIVAFGRSGNSTVLQRFNTETPPQRLYAEQDADYNVTSITNNSGQVVERYSYDPYGTATVENMNGYIEGSGSLVSSDYHWTVLHQGLTIDLASGLSVNRFRSYDPTLGRFLQQDPAHYIDTYNLYQTERSSPDDRVDVLGTDSTSDAEQQLQLLLEIANEFAHRDPRWSKANQCDLQAADLEAALLFDQRWLAIQNQNQQWLISTAGGTGSLHLLRHNLVKLTPKPGNTHCAMALDTFHGPQHPFTGRGAQLYPFSQFQSSYPNPVDADGFLLWLLESITSSFANMHDL